MQMSAQTAAVLHLTSAEAFGGAGGCWTIDSSTADNGFLVCARQGHPGSGSHGSTKQAVDNLLACLPALAAEVVGDAKRTANIVGHGNDGIIVTGTGQNVSDPLKYIAWWNRGSWQADIGRLRGRTAILKLWACHPGTAQEGLDLLNFLCQESGAICMGPTGFLYCGGGNFSLEPNSTWQVVTPGQPLPAPIQAPTPHFDEAASMKLSTDSGYIDVPAEQVTRIEIASGDATRTMATLPSDRARDFIGTVAFDSPMRVEGVPAAILTARVRVYFAGEAARRVGDTREFLVWNDRQLEDSQRRGTFYQAMAGLRTFLRSIQ